MQLIGSHHLLAREVHLCVLIMATVVRVLLWTAVIVAPGGVLLAPLLAANELKRRAKAAAEAQAAQVHV